MHQIKAKILYNQKVIEKCYKISLHAPEVAQESYPGQFVHIRCTEGYNPLMRRPFSIYKADKGKIEILYKVVGKGTHLLSSKRIGEKVDILGPLGRGFKINSSLVRRVVLVAGGIGIAPLYFLASKLMKILEKKQKEKNFIPLPLIIIGAENEKKILEEEAFKALMVEVKIATDDGSKGFKGKATDFFASLFLIPKFLSSVDVYACGPLLMLKKIANLSYKYGFPCQLSLEQKMGCGIGACLGCVVKGRNGYLRVCKDGPVFDAREIDWNGVRSSNFTQRDF
ncbi:dihydroorotate dehydrogenase electron transfer subunit [Candidatus Aerophobetes bacterium]|nr:dihydroorotate dehydrogenase electron transfer subunit [Candidatus Aerophobetes bacterium]